MLYALIILAICAFLLLLVLIRMTLTLNDISISLKRIARQKQETKNLVHSTVTHKDSAEGKSSPDEAEIAAVIAVARDVADGFITIG